MTLESALLVKDILSQYPSTFSENDLLTTKSYLIKSNARAFETANAKLNMLSNISNYNLEPNYIEKREEIVNNMSIEKIKSLAEKYVDPNKMIWLFVGDAKTQLNRLKKTWLWRTYTIRLLALKKRICIIGAGPSGITAIKNLSEAGLDIVAYDINKDVGGNWIFNEKEGHSSVFETTHIISSKSLSQYEDMPFGSEVSDYPSHDVKRIFSVIC